MTPIFAGLQSSGSLGLPPKALPQMQTWVCLPQKRVRGRGSIAPAICLLWQPALSRRASRPSHFVLFFPHDNLVGIGATLSLDRSQPLLHVRQKYFPEPPHHNAAQHGWCLDQHVCFRSPICLAVSLQLLRRHEELPHRQMVVQLRRL
jgi:hypothetical protein